MTQSLPSAYAVAPGLAILEGAFLVLWVSRFWVIARKTPGAEPFDDGPWWSVTFFRVWAACQIPVLMLQAGVHALLKKPSFSVRMPLVVAAFLMHAMNFVLVLALLAVSGVP